MPDQRYDVSAKTAWNRNSPGSKREDGRTGGREKAFAGVGLKTSAGIVELSRGFLVYDSTLLPVLRRTFTPRYIHASIYEFYVMRYPAADACTESRRIYEGSNTN